MSEITKRLAEQFPGPLPEGTRVGFHALPEARGVLAGGTFYQRRVILDGTGQAVMVDNRDVFKVTDEVDNGR